MNYESTPDLRPEGISSVDTVLLFQRFRQAADIAFLEKELENEVRGHLAKCQLAILAAAARGFYWCEYPEHPLREVDAIAQDRLTKMGFRMDSHDEADERTAPSRGDRTKTLTAVVFRSHKTIGWLVAPTQSATREEWRRREKLEDADRKRHPPERLSRGSFDSIEYGDAIWAASHNSGKWFIEVQRINQRYFLCIFDSENRCIQVEGTSVAFGARFGPDASDIRCWMERADRIVSTL